MNNIERYETSFVIPVANESNNWLTTQPASLDFVISNLTDVCNILRTKNNQIKSLYWRSKNYF